MWTIIGILIYLVIAYFAYVKITKNWNSHPTWERIYFAVIWVLLIPLYGIHLFYNKVL
jgi:hypothetical protein